MSIRKRTVLSSIAATSAAAVLLMGCSSAPEAEEGPVLEADPELHALLPDRIQEAGEIKVGTEAFYPPHEYFDEDQETIIGVDPDIVYALGEVLGVKIKLENMAWDGLLPALDAGRIDMISAAIGINETRVEKYDFISYFSTPQGVTVLAGNPLGIEETSDLCGLNVSVLDASHQLDVLQGLNEDLCKNDPMEILAFPADSDALQQLQSGRADTHLAQFPAAQYNAETFGEGETFEAILLPELEPQTLGKAFRKDDPELRDAVLAAMNELIASGRYLEILTENNLESGAIEQSEVNPL
ncbi:polar amino acid transport system substrate-binding protein [Leucobacter exalbidus]|uniref:Polar amino acid transport system substrate-binding protein n=1 Tax=Leucobacter exalbidus TaxID=662960 RepID=A0A940PM77_9MICO|nr:ABC transporter substrate-binding protein [Leucobacter exalbidus]MBP1326497.1 polar amino acid transport system substrate-binding protein [Leucobacter exalbidus]